MLNTLPISASEMFITIIIILYIIYLYIYIWRILHSSTVSVGLAQARPNYRYYAILSSPSTTRLNKYIYELPHHDITQDILYFHPELYYHQGPLMQCPHCLPNYAYHNFIIFLLFHMFACPLTLHPLLHSSSPSHTTSFLVC